jgi:hypothetical protein
VTVHVKCLAIYLRLSTAPMASPIAAYHRQPRLQRRRRALWRYRVHLLSCRRHHAVHDRALRHAGANPATTARLPRGVRHELARFHYDTAQSANSSALSCLLKVVSVSQVLYGTDFPFGTRSKRVEGLRTCGFLPAELSAIERDNALQLLPSLKGPLFAVA